jgi:hypothetical protein
MYKSILLILAVFAFVLVNATLSQKVSAQAISECQKTGTPGNGTICCYSADGKRVCRPRRQGE